MRAAGCTRVTRRGRRLTVLGRGLAGDVRADRSSGLFASSSSRGRARSGTGAVPVSTSTARRRIWVSIQSRSADAGMRSSRSSRRCSWSSRSYTVPLALLGGARHSHPAQRSVSADRRKNLSRVWPRTRHVGPRARRPLQLLDRSADHARVPWRHPRQGRSGAARCPTATPQAPARPSRRRTRQARLPSVRGRAGRQAGVGACRPVGYLPRCTTRGIRAPGMFPRLGARDLR